MTHSKIQKMKFFVFLFIFLLAQIAICDGNLRKKDSPLDVSPAIKQNSKLNKTDSSQHISDSIKNGTATANKIDDKVAITTQQSIRAEEEHIPGLNSAALFRGLYVFLCVGIIVLAYIMFRTFRINKSRTQMIRKYGVLTHRQDVEMRPLPLDEDDDDDTTIFDARNIGVHGRTEQHPISA